SPSPSNPGLCCDSTKRSKGANIGGFSPREVIDGPAQKDHRRNSSARLSSSNAAILVSAVLASHWRLHARLASILTKTSSAACSPSIIGLEQETTAHPG